jgi:transcriptional regulator with XRE-family HTH domain
MLLHKRLRTLRQASNLRLKDVSLTCGLSVPDLSELERGRTPPSLNALEAIAQAYTLTVQEVLMDVNGYGTTTDDGLPAGLAVLIADPVLSQGLTPDWVHTLARIELRGKRPRDKDAWYEIWWHLRWGMV